MAVFENINIDIDKGILHNTDIDKISYRLGFGISNTPIWGPYIMIWWSYYDVMIILSYYGHMMIWRPVMIWEPYDDHTMIWWPYDNQACRSGWCLQFGQFSSFSSSTFFCRLKSKTQFGCRSVVLIFLKIFTNYILIYIFTLIIIVVLHLYYV